MNKSWRAQHALPAALSKAGGSPHSLKAPARPDPAIALLCLPFTLLSAAKEWLLEVHFLPVFIPAESVAALCWGTCEIM